MALIASNDRIHGYNPLYQFSNKAQFNCFTAQPCGKPSPFIPGVVSGNYDNTAEFPLLELDHQRHIVSQQAMVSALSNIAAKVSAVLGGKNSCQLTLDNVNRYLNFHYPKMNFSAVTHYIKISLMAKGGACETAFVTTTRGDSVENRVGGYFSVIVWNPINLCRAPVEAVRDKYSANTVDNQIRTHLIKYSNKPGITLSRQMRLAFKTLGSQPDEQQLQRYIARCNASLVENHYATRGYYSFNWKQDPTNRYVLIPDQIIDTLRCEF